MLIREPLVHFIAAGMVIFLVGQIHHERSDRHHIVITPERTARLANQYALQFGKRPDATTLDALVNTDVHDEILFREGLILGLDRDDEIVRRRIVQKMRFLLQDLQLPGEPSEAQLQAYYREHLDSFSVPARVSFTHIYFSAGADEADGRQRALAALHDLPVGTARAIGKGDPFPDLYDFSKYTAEQVERLFGKSEFSTAVFSTPPGQWAGPFKSVYGWHLLYVESQEPEKARPFSAVSGLVRARYLSDAQDRTNDEAFRQLAREFVVVRNRPETSP